MRILVDGQTLATPDIHRGIGRVLVQLCEELLPADRANEWYFAVRSEKDLGALGEEARRLAVALPVAMPAEAADPTARSRAYSREIARACDEQDIQLYWNPNPLMANVTLPLELEGVRKVCTIYDLIPLMLRERYLDTWPRRVRDDYLARVAGLPAWADHLAFISAGARDDFLRIDPSIEKRSSVIHLGADHVTFWAPAVPDPSSSPPYVLLVGGADPRKNLESGIAAFAAARDRDARLADCRLVVVGGGDDAWQRRLAHALEAHGVSERAELIDWVDDAGLARLYRRAAVFFFPSLYEGFGLPVVEALACGAPVVVSDRPELHECAGEWGLYCDPTRVESMADALVEALTRPERNRAERSLRVAWADRFDWTSSAARYSELFDGLGARIQPVCAAGRSRPRVAWLSPWPPDRTGVADFSAELTDALRERVDIELFLEDPDAADARLELVRHPLDEFRERHRDYDAIVYHLGNNSQHHARIYRLAWEIPGLVVLHDFNIHPFLHHAYLDTAEEWLYLEALEEAHGDEGRAHFEAVRSGRSDPDFWRYPLAHAIAARSHGVIVHSAWAREALGDAASIFTIPLFAPTRESRSPAKIAALRASLGLDPERFAIGVFGFLNRQKRISVIVEACAQLHERGYPIQLLLVGSTIDPHLALDELLAEYGIEDFTTHTGYVSEERFWDYLDASDVVMNLRFPSMGESSLSLSRALGSGKPCLVTDFGPFAELPDAVCWKAEVGPHEADQIVAYLEELLGDPELRLQLGQDARRFVAGYASKERAVALYESAIASVASVAAVPAAPRGSDSTLRAR